MRSTFPKPKMIIWQKLRKFHDGENFAREVLNLKRKQSWKSKIFQENFSGCNIYLKMTDNVEKWVIMVKIGKTWRKWENNTNEWGYVFEILKYALQYYIIWCRQK